MRYSHLFRGKASAFIPMKLTHHDTDYLSDFNNSYNGVVVSSTTSLLGNDLSNCKVIFFDMDMPSDEEVFDIKNEDILMENYADNEICRLEGITLHTIFDGNKHERTYYKTPIDAIEMETKKAGEIKSAVVILPTVGSTDWFDEDEQFLFFTNSIDGWNNNDKMITVDKMTSEEQGDIIIFKDFSFKLKDSESTGSVTL